VATRREAREAASAAASEELRPRGGDEQDARVADESDEVLQEIELAALRPVDVLQHEKRRLPERGRLDEAPRREEEKLWVDGGVAGAKAEQEPEMTLRLCDFSRGQDLLDGTTQLRARDFRRIRVEDAARRPNDLRESLVARLPSIRQATAAQGLTAALGHKRLGLAAESRLPNARWAEQGHQVRAPLLPCARPQRTDHLELAVPADQGMSRDRALGGGSTRLDREPCGHRLGLSLGPNRFQRLVADHVARRLMGEVPDDQPSGRGCRLEPRGRVDDIADRQSLSRPVAADRDHRISGVDSRTGGEIEPVGAV
jgi:hypothetical protein